MGYAQLIDIERLAIADYLKQGKSYSEIARLIERNVSTVSREIKRNSRNGVYNPAIAQERANVRKHKKTNRSRFTEEIKEKIEKGLEKNWSPEQIKGYYARNGEEMVSTKTIYRYIHSGKVGKKKELRRKGKPYVPKDPETKILGKESIHARPAVVKERERIGDWEIDTVVSGKVSKACLVTLVDRKSRYLLAKVVQDRKAPTVTQAILEMLEDNIVTSLTSDNGKEFAGYEELQEKLGVTVYFADPYCSWQRGSNENTNGLLRQYLPKKTDLSKITQEELDYYVSLINHRPRKIHEFATNYEVYHSIA
ncbi:IS30 family transposase [Enterococcus cecorum]|uniref:IS30 family transposase n=1 Tax=Enterococcus cecorum TaxID=44008 RepID=UPI0038B37A25